MLVLDEAPDELVTLIGYLESISDRLTVDLITVTAYNLDGRRIVVPHRVTPERPCRAASDETYGAANSGRLSGRRGQVVAGVAPFAGAIESAPAKAQPALTKLARLAERLEDEGLAEPDTYFGKRGELVLVPRLRPERVGLVSLWQWTDGHAIVTGWRTVFDRRAPDSISTFEAAAAPVPLGQGREISTITDELIEAIHQAYREAAGRT